VPDEKLDVDRELTTLEAELKRLEAEYNMFFAGRLPRPPWETRGRVEAHVKRIDRLRLMNTGDRFRFEMIQTRFQTFIDLWDRGLRSREEGRAGPFAQPKAVERPRPAIRDRVVSVTTLSDPSQEMDKVQELYQNLVEARREAGQDGLPFPKFAELIKKQVGTLRLQGSSEVAFRVALKDGKVAFTARAMKDGNSED
jgi:hypothetical protein